MKTFRLLLLGIPFVLLAVARPVAADPATVTRFGEDSPCPFLWGGTDAANVGHLVVLEGTGVLVESNNERGNASYQCHGQIDFGATVVAPEFPTMLPVMVRLATIEEACVAFPDACKGNGALLATFENTGILCQGISSFYQEVVTPDGQAQLICHLPD
jgi:hypothetical protein